MRYLKTYNESVHPTKEDFQAIADTLQSDIFDEYNIPYVEDVEIISDEERWDKRWEYSYNRGGDMCQINILNLKPVESRDIMKKVVELMPTIKGRTGFDIDPTEHVNDGMNFTSYDIIVKVRNADFRK